MPSYGLSLRKIDLHVHTPASRCYSRRNDTAEQIVQAALDKGLDAIAVTDHNSASLVDRIAAKAVGTPLVVFPGVEISTHEGYHIIALFDVGVSQAVVENFLGAVGIPAEQYGRSDFQSEKGVYEILATIHERQGLGVLAHIDAPKGAFYELRSVNPEDGTIRVPGTCVGLFNDGGFDAVEIVNPGLPAGLDREHGINKRPAFYWASDNPDPNDPLHHSCEGIGHNYSLFNVDEVSLEGLRLCFTDPEVRIWHRDHEDGRIWPCVAEMLIGADGFLAHQRFGFHRGLNSVVGGKGTGKSLAIEFLRFALGQPSSIGEISDDHFGKLDRRLCPLNTVEVQFTVRSGESYRLKRKYEGNRRSSVECVNTRTGDRYEGDVAQLFPILAYSQTEVIKTAEDERAQLALLDALIDPRPFQREIGDLQQQLSRNDRSVAESLAARAKADSLLQDLNTVNEQVRVIDQVLQSDLLAEMRLAELKKARLQAEEAFLSDVESLEQKAADEIRVKAHQPPPDELADDPLVKEQWRRAEVVKDGVLQMLANSKAEAEAALAEVSAATEQWMPEFEETKARYEQGLQGGDKAQLEADRRRLEGQRAQVEQDYAEAAKTAQGLAACLDVRSNLLDRLDSQYAAYFDARQCKFQELTRASDGRLRLTLRHAANSEQYAGKLSELLAGSGTSTVSTSHRKAIAEKVVPRDLGDIIITRDIDRLSACSGLSRDMAERALNRLWANDDLGSVLALQHAYYPADIPSIEYNKGDEQFANLRELSVGQKCTSLLILALCDGDMPVVIDQPEDALDIATVWEDIATKLRRGKSARQFILTTHNSSLAVGSDSDLFMVLTPMSADRAKLSYKGAIDRQDVRQAVVRHLEGGDEPYKLRQRKYNIK